MIIRAYRPGECAVLARLFYDTVHAVNIRDYTQQQVDAPLLTANVSITARPFFEQRGYRVVREQRILRRGVWLSNYRMEK